MFWFLTFEYCVVVGLVATAPMWETQNYVKRLALGVGWPIVLSFYAVKGLIWLGRRFWKDTRALLPRRPVAKIPKQVTVQMLADSPDQEFQPGRWMKP